MKNFARFQIKRSIGTSMLIIFLVVFFGAVIVGGRSLYLVHRMMRKTFTIEQESKNVDFINHIHDKTYNLILAIHHFIISPDEESSRQAQELLAVIEHDLHTYIRYEEEESGNLEKDEELRLLMLINENLIGVRGMVPIFEDITRNKRERENLRVIQDLEKFAYRMEGLAGAINKVHFQIISDKVIKSQERLSSIFLIFIVFSSAGLICIIIGYRLHGKYIVKPIKVLADATQRLAKGDLSVKVATNSKSEIGVLYNSFNTMTEELSSNEKQLLDFNSALERKVADRTRELTTAYDSLKQAQKDLVRLERIATLGQIAASVNHEIKTPLNSLYMNLQLLKKKVNQPGGEASDAKRDINDMISIIDRETLRISGILEEFVRFARFSPPELNMNDLNKTVEDVADRISERVDEANVKLELALSGKVPRFLFDDKKIMQVLINLCINAIHAMPDGGILTIETAVREEGMAYLAVSDTGAGISGEDREKIFQPFFSKKEGGLGLGLAIVSSIIEGHGGSIACRSTVGQGTTFDVLLPLTGGLFKAKDLQQ